MMAAASYEILRSSPDRRLIASLFLDKLLAAVPGAKEVIDRHGKFKAFVLKCHYLTMINGADLGKQGGDMITLADEAASVGSCAAQPCVTQSGMRPASQLETVFQAVMGKALRDTPTSAGASSSFSGSGRDAAISQRERQHGAVLPGVGGSGACADDPLAALAAAVPAVVSVPRAARPPVRWACNRGVQVWGEVPDQIFFETSVVMPRGRHVESLVPGKSGLPLVFYFGGLGQNGDGAAAELGGLRSNFSQVASEPFVLVQPKRPDRKWWFIDDDRLPWGYVYGDFIPEMVETYGKWISDISARPGIDESRVALCGFSSGAYACLELLADGGCGALCGVGLVAAHGHSRGDLSEVPAKGGSLPSEDKFPAFLDRIGSHMGCPWIEATHAPTDTRSDMDDARMIFDQINERQSELGHPELVVREVAPEDMDKKPGDGQNDEHHEYSRTALIRREFLLGLFEHRCAGRRVRTLEAELDVEQAGEEASDPSQTNQPRWGKLAQLPS